MTKLYIIMAMIILPNLSYAFGVPTQESVVSINSAFIPGGFDSQSEVFAVVSGIFPNSCYAWKGANVVRQDGNRIEVTGLANVTQGMCMMVLVPFQREVQIGQLNAGTYTLHFNNGDGTHFEQSLTIEQ